MKKLLCKRATLHAMTIKAHKRGHPFCTLDSFSKDFDPRADLIIGVDHTDTEVALLINDSKHPKIKGRLFSLLAPFNELINKFWNEIENRLLAAFNKRVIKSFFNERDNIYLTYGEVDYLPGLYILKIDHCLFIQWHIDFWKRN